MGEIDLRPGGGVDGERIAIAWVDGHLHGLIRAVGDRAQQVAALALPSGEDHEVLGREVFGQLDPGAVAERHVPGGAGGPMNAHPDRTIELVSRAQRMRQ